MLGTLTSVVNIKDHEFSYCQKIYNQTICILYIVLGNMLKSIELDISGLFLTILKLLKRLTKKKRSQNGTKWNRIQC